MAVALRPRDSVRFNLSRTTAAPRGADITATTPGLHRSRRIGMHVYVDSSFNAGLTWATVDVAADAATDSIPTIAADRFDNLYLCYHDADAVRIYLSRDLGVTWEPWDSVSGGKKHGRIAFAADRQYLALWSGGSVTLYESTDYLLTRTVVLTFAADEHLVDLDVDRHGWRHLTYEASGDIYQRMSPDGADWTRAADLLATGRSRPSLATAAPRGLLLRWDGDSLAVDVLASDYVTAAGTPAAITTTLSRQYLGFAFDRMETAWIVGLEDDNTTTTLYNSRYGDGSWTAL